MPETMERVSEEGCPTYDQCTHNAAIGSVCVKAGGAVGWGACGWGGVGTGLGALVFSLPLMASVAVTDPRQMFAPKRRVLRKQ